MWMWIFFFFYIYSCLKSQSQVEVAFISVYIKNNAEKDALQFCISA